MANGGFPRVLRMAWTSTDAERIVDDPRPVENLFARLEVRSFCGFDPVKFPMCGVVVGAGRP